jgi:hypothetical protein
MKRCSLCGMLRHESDFLARCCGRCDKLIGDAAEDLRLELSRENA